MRTGSVARSSAARACRARVGVPVGRPPGRFRDDARCPMRYREEDLDLVQPRGVGRGELEAPARVVFQPVGDLLGAAGGEVVTDSNDFLALARRESRCRAGSGSGSDRGGCGSLRTSRARHLRGLSDRRTGTACRCAHIRARAVSTRPGAGRTSGLVGALAWMPVFSSRDRTSTFSGGFTYRPQISLQRSSNSGWEKSVIIQ